mmetsp:Transcript_37030/g.110346  ORF Transcript_37030/g.110346 Transcript_37030/m.110346 type:complete len:241 (-) Transcript_37030:939-1661(-)
MSKSRRATMALQVSLSRRAAPPGSPAPKACADELWATAPAGSRACWAAPPSRRRRARGPPPSPAAARATMARAWRRARRALPSERRGARWRASHSAALPSPLGWRPPPAGARLAPTEERRDGWEEAAWVVRHRHRQTGRISRLGLHLKDGDMARAVEGVELPVAVPPAEARERLLDGGAGRVRLLEQHQVLPAGEGPLDQCRRSRRLLVAALDADPCLVLEGDVGSLLPPPDSAALVLVW